MPSCEPHYLRTPLVDRALICQKQSRAAQARSLPVHVALCLGEGHATVQISP